MSIKNVMYVLGIILILAGLIGFVNHPILGIFEVDTMHNLVHLVAGILALVFAGRGSSQARMFALVLGVVFALLTVLGFLASGKLLGFIANNSADNWLHLIFAVIFLIFGLKKSDGNMSSAM